MNNHNQTGSTHPEHPANIPTALPAAGNDAARAAGNTSQLEQIHQAEVSLTRFPTGISEIYHYMDDREDDGVEALVLLGTPESQGSNARSFLEALNAKTVKGKSRTSPGDIVFSGLDFGNCDVLVADIGAVATRAQARQAADTLANTLIVRGYEKVIIIPEAFGCDFAAAFEEMVYGIQMGVYFPSMKSAGVASRLKQVIFAVPEGTNEDLDADGIIARASNSALGSQYMRQLVQMPPNVMGTAAFYRAAMAISERCPAVKVTCETVGRESDLRMMYAVGRASNQPTYVITLRYEGNPDAPLQAIVGKGLVYDTGGINLKPNGGAGMKADMGGGAMVLGTVLAAALNEAPVNMVAIVGAVCNDIGPNAYRPDDVLTAHNGKTVEVINTDAEGRLVLADCLSYVEKTYAPARVFSFATLTGAATIASGRRAPFFSDDGSFAVDMEMAGEGAEEMLLHFPMDDYLKPTMVSTIADLRNTGTGRECGHTTAAIFLNHFVENTPYCHIDIAGASSLDPSRGGGAFGILTMMEYFRLTTEERA